MPSSAALFHLNLCIDLRKGHVADMPLQFFKERIQRRITMERTLSIIKPDGVSRRAIGEVIRRFEANKIKIVAMKMIYMTKSQAQGFYAVHKERPFFDSVTDFMSSGPSVVMVLEGENVIAKNRELMGATDFRKAAEGTIRRDFATDIEKNVVHGSDAPETAAFEISYFFNRLEIVG
jgi:nucleoside-diphosphate kinase